MLTGLAIVAIHSALNPAKEIQNAGSPKEALFSSLLMRGPPDSAQSKWSYTVNHASHTCLREYPRIPSLPHL